MQQDKADERDTLDIIVAMTAFAVNALGGVVVGAIGFFGWEPSPKILGIMLGVTMVYAGSARFLVTTRTP